MAVGSTTLQPGASTTLVFPFLMHDGMGGPHRFQVTLLSNDPREPQKTIEIKAFAGR